MLAWIERGAKPTPASVAAACEPAKAQYGEACHFDPGWSPPPLETRVCPRQKPALPELQAVILRGAQPPA
jgi:hypothetical protein